MVTKKINIAEFFYIAIAAATRFLCCEKQAFSSLQIYYRVYNIKVGEMGLSFTTMNRQERFYVLVHQIILLYKFGDIFLYL